MKAGGPNYVAQFMRFRDREDVTRDVRRAVASPDLEALRRALLAMVEQDAAPLPRDEAIRVLHAIVSYDRWYAEEFGRSHDHQKLLGQDNFRRYLPVRALRVRVHADDSAFEIFARVCAARTVGSRATVSVPGGFRSSKTIAALERLTEAWEDPIECVEESNGALAQVVQAHRTDRLRYAARERVPEAVRRAVAARGIHVADEPVLAEGRIELLWYVVEQSISHDYHRYGHLGARAGETRREPPTL